MKFQTCWLNFLLLTNLFDKDGQALVFERFGEVDVAGSLWINRQGGHNHVCLFADQLRNDSIPLLLTRLVDL